MITQGLKLRMLLNSQTLKFNPLQKVLLVLGGFFSLFYVDFAYSEKSGDLVLPYILLGKERPPLERLRENRRDFYHSMDFADSLAEPLNAIASATISKVEPYPVALLPIRQRETLSLQAPDNLKNESKLNPNHSHLNHQHALINTENSQPSGHPLLPEQNEVLTFENKKFSMDKKKGTGQQIWVESGVNHVIPMAINHLNRVVIPFDNPLVKTGSDFLMELEDKVIYVLLDNYEPVSLFITDPKDPLKTLSLTLVAKKIAPRNIQLRVNFEEDNALSEANQLPLFSHDAIKQNKTSLYQGLPVKQIFKELLNNRRPKGFSVRKKTQKSNYPYCQQKGLSFNFQEGLYLTSENQEVITGKVKNLSKEMQEIQFESCQSKVSIAVGLFPEKPLPPGAFATIILVNHKSLEEKSSQGFRDEGL